MHFLSEQTLSRILLLVAFIFLNVFKGRATALRDFPYLCLPNSLWENVEMAGGKRARAKHCRSEKSAWVDQNLRARGLLQHCCGFRAGFVRVLLRCGAPAENRTRT